MLDQVVTSWIEQGHLVDVVTYLCDTVSQNLRSEELSNIPGGNDMNGNICFFASGFAAAAAFEFPSFCFCVSVSILCKSAMGCGLSNLRWWLSSVYIVVLVNKVLIVGVVVFDCFA